MKKLLIHASLDFKEQMIAARDYIQRNTDSIEVILPDLTRYQYIRDKLNDDVTFTKIKNRLTFESFKNVEKCDVLLVLNYTHRGVENYIGGNSFMEMILATYLHKPVYLLNEIPTNMAYTEEIKSLYPCVIKNLDNLINEI